MRNKDKIEVFITVILVGIFMWGFLRKFIYRKGSEPSLKREEIKNQRSSSERQGNISLNYYDNLCSKYKDLEILRDPFSSQVFDNTGIKYGVSSNLSWNISGIIWDENNPQVIINGKILGLGDKIDNFRIIKITPKSIIISDGYIEEELFLP